MLPFSSMSLEQLFVLSDALTQFVDNQAERDEGEPEPAEVGIAQDMLDTVEAERVRRLMSVERADR